MALSIRAQHLLSVVVDGCKYQTPLNICDWRRLDRIPGIGLKAVEELVTAGYLEAEEKTYLQPRRYRLGNLDLSMMPDLGDLWID